MPAISFSQEFIDPLLRGDKQQTTRKQTARIKVGDMAHIYIMQRNMIINKPIRQMTAAGLVAMADRVRQIPFPNLPECRYGVFPSFYAHFLGKVVITEVYDILPNRMAGADQEEWARLDGFQNFDEVDTWFTDHYDEYWIDRTWTVIKWDGWHERYFEAEQ